MSNYNLKSQLLNSGVYDLYAHCMRALYCFDTLYRFGDGSKFPPFLIPFLNFPIFDYLTAEELKECNRLFDANRKRAARLKKRVTKMIEKPCLFLTFTFNEDSLNNTNSSTRRRYVREFLSDFDVPAVANKDFGAEKGREHYHAIIQVNHINYTLFRYGALNGERVINSKNCDIRISKYIAKLTNHAIKETTQRSSLIYLHMNKLN